MNTFFLFPKIYINDVYKYLNKSSLRSKYGLQTFIKI